MALSLRRGSGGTYDLAVVNAYGIWCNAGFGHFGRQIGAERRRRSSSADPPNGTVARSITTLEPHENGFTTMPRLMDYQARARLTCLQREGTGVVSLIPANGQCFALQDNPRHGSKSFQQDRSRTAQHCTLNWNGPIDCMFDQPLAPPRPTVDNNALRATV